MDYISKESTSSRRQIRDSWQCANLAETDTHVRVETSRTPLNLCTASLCNLLQVVKLLSILSFSKEIISLKRYRAVSGILHTWPLRYCRVVPSVGAPDKLRYADRLRRESFHKMTPGSNHGSASHTNDKQQQFYHSRTLRLAFPRCTRGRQQSWCTLPLISHSLRLAACLLYTSPSPRDLSTSRMPSSA